MNNKKVYDDPKRFKRLAKRLKKEEGVKYKPYKLKGEEHYTVGIGHYGKDVDPSKTYSKDEVEELFRKDLNRKVSMVSKRIKGFNSMNPETQDAIVSSFFRGGLSGSPNTINAINEGRFEDASKEFLDNAEYRRRSKSKEKSLDRGVAERMERLSTALHNEGLHPISPKMEEREGHLIINKIKDRMKKRENRNKFIPEVN